MQMISNQPNEIDFSPLDKKDSEFTDQSLTLIHQWVNYYGNAFLTSEDATVHLPEPAKREFYSQLFNFSESCYRYQLEKPGQWQPETVQSVCIDILPKQVIADKVYFETLIPNLSNFIRWLEPYKVCKNADALLFALGEVAGSEKLFDDDHRADLSFSELAFDYGKFPKRALKWAAKNPSKVIPTFLTWLDETVDNFRGLDDRFVGYFYATYLLGYFQEPKAFPLLLKLIDTKAVWQEEYYHAFLCNVLSAAIAGAYTNQFDALLDRIAKRHRTELTRAILLDTMLVLINLKKLTREQVLDGYQTLLGLPAIRKDKDALTNILWSASDLQPIELYDEIKACYENKLVDQKIIKLEQFEDDFKRDQKRFLQAKLYQNKVYQPLGDPVTEIYRLIADETVDREVGHTKLPNSTVTIPSHERVGRNDPCPCGSGKKYKKCCLH